jgi:hypothetical protein
MKLAYILIRDVKCCEHIGKQFGSFFTKLSIHFVLGFHHCDKIPEINNLRGKRFILAHGVRDYNPPSLVSIASGFLCGKDERHGRELWWSKVSHLIISTTWK